MTYEIPLNNNKEIALVGDIAIRFYFPDGKPKLNEMESVIKMYRHNGDIEWLKKESYLIIYEKPFISQFGLNNN